MSVASQPATAPAVEPAEEPGTELVHPPVRTFKARRGRLTPAQAGALARLWPRYGITVGRHDASGPTEPLDLDALFGRSAPVVLEIGCGMGEATSAMAAAQPERDVLAVDVHTPGLGSLLRTVEALGLGNVRVAECDARVLLALLRPDSLAEVRVFFPDPWPKTRHHKRRLVTPAFLDLVSARLAPGGLLHVATDWTPYADEIAHVLAGHPMLRRCPTALWRPVTRYERQGLAAGRISHDLAAVQVSSRTESG